MELVVEVIHTVYFLITTRNLISLASARLVPCVWYFVFLRGQSRVSMILRWLHIGVKEAAARVLNICREVWMVVGGFIGHVEWGIELLLVHVRVDGFATIYSIIHIPWLHLRMVCRVVLLSWGITFDFRDAFWMREIGGTWSQIIIFTIFFHGSTPESGLIKWILLRSFIRTLLPTI